MSNQEIYHSSTMGDIPLSFTGRHLLQALREAIIERDQKVINEYGMRLNPTGPGHFGHWDEVSRTRGRIAKYMSELESKQLHTLKDYAEARCNLHLISDAQLIRELERRMYKQAGLPYSRD